MARDTQGKYVAQEPVEPLIEPVYTDEDMCNPNYIKVENTPQFKQLFSEFKHHMERADKLEKDLAATQYDVNEMRKLYHEATDQLQKVKMALHQDLAKSQKKVRKYKQLVLQLMDFIHNEDTELND